ncbi:hypothetical protein IFM89_011095, partial [Coptis chinensis]
AALNHSQISKFSKRDADAYPRYESQLVKFCEFMDPLLDSPPPEALHHLLSYTDIVKDKLRKSAYWAHCLRQAFKLGQNDMVDFMDLLVAPASKVLNNWFETDVLKATLATDAVIGTMGHTPGSGYVLLHHVMGETDGDRGIWSYVEGGMGAISLAISNAATEAGAYIVTNTECTISEDSGAINGVLLADGTRVQSSVVLSNATPYRTFMELIPQTALPTDFYYAIKNSDYSSPGALLTQMPVRELVMTPCGEGYDKNYFGSSDCPNFSAVNLLFMRLDRSMLVPFILVQKGKHVINLFIQYTPYKPLEGSWEDTVFRESFAKRCFSLIDEYAPGFRSSIIGYDMLTPPDLQKGIRPHRREYLPWYYGPGFTFSNATGQRMVVHLNLYQSTCNGFVVVASKYFLQTSVILCLQLCVELDGVARQIDVDHVDSFCFDSCGLCG